MADMDERLNQWLRDAHAMELQAEHMLNGLAGRIESYPELGTRIDSISSRRSHKSNDWKPACKGAGHLPRE